jgi:hypothetical protein
MSTLWEQLGLGGARYRLDFRTQRAARLAVKHLMTCHPHHIAVVGEGQVVVMSALAVNCLQAEFGDTIDPEKSEPEPVSSESGG